MGRSIMPVMIGMNPPTKEIFLMRTTKPMAGYACIINHATFPEETRRGTVFDIRDNTVQRISTAAWLQFTDADAMRRFGQALIDFANNSDRREE